MKHDRSHPAPPAPAAILIVPLVVALVLTLFAWPSARLEPRDLPIGVAGPPAAAEALERGSASAGGRVRRAAATATRPPPRGDRGP